MDVKQKRPGSITSTRTPDWFDRWCRRVSMKPVCRVREKDGDVLIADSGKAIEIDGKLYVRTGYALERDGVQLGATQLYDPIEFFKEGPQAGQQRRINEALDAARKLKARLREVNYWV